METTPPSVNVMTMNPDQQGERETETNETQILRLRGGCGVSECLAYIFPILLKIIVRAVLCCFASEELIKWCCFCC